MLPCWPGRDDRRARDIMTASGGRGSTRRGRPAPLPAEAYQTAGSAQHAVQVRGGGSVVLFQGEDDRTAVFSFASLPLPGWHAALAVGLARRTGPGGGLRTLASAHNTWAVLKRLLRFVASQPDPPDSPANLTRARIEAFLRHRSATIGNGSAWAEVRAAGRLLAALPPDRAVREEVLDFVFQRVEGLVFPVKTGYSDHELRQLIAAARTDVARLQDRIRSGHALAGRWRAGDTELTGRQRIDAEMLARIAETGWCLAWAWTV